MFYGTIFESIQNYTVWTFFSVSDLEKDVFKYLTISTNYNRPSTILLYLNKNSNVKVSISPENIKEMPFLLEGLEKLNRSW